MDRQVCDTLEQARGCEQPHWPVWAKPSLGPDRPRKLGCIEFIGDEPYTEPTPRQLDVFKDLDLTDEVIRLKSAAVREAIREYLPPNIFFDEWLPCFIDLIDRPAFFRNVWNALERLPHHFNLRAPDLVAPDDTLRKYLTKGPNLARYVLSFAKNQIQARDHPEVVLALAIFQASHRSFLDRLHGDLYLARIEEQLNDEQWVNADAVIDGPFRQFDDFMIFSTLLPLILLRRGELCSESESSACDRRTTQMAITQAWEIFIDKKILRRDFESGGRMICPANQHLRFAKENMVIEKLFDFVCDNANSMPIRKLLMQTRRVATLGAYFKVGNYWEGLAEAVHRNKDARGGKGLRL